MLRTSARISALRTSAGALGVRGLSCGPLAASLRTGCAYGRTLRTGSLHSLPLAAASSVSSSFSGASGLPLFRRHYDALLATQVRAFSAAAAAAPPPPPPAASAPSDSNSSSSKDGEKNDNNAPVVSSTTQSSEPVVVDDGIISAGEVGRALLIEKSWRFGAFISPGLRSMCGGLVFPLERLGGFAMYRRFFSFLCCLFCDLSMISVSLFPL